MIDVFKEFLTGKFENKRQAFSYPSKFAFIRITHVDIGDNLFYGEQAYTYNIKNPYRQFVLEPIQEGNKIRILNYEIQNQKEFAAVQNLDKLNRSMLSLKDGCDVIVEQQNNSFVGGIEGCDCYVNWRGRDTYLTNKIELGENYYYVIDQGISIDNGSQIWGSKNGKFEFDKMPL